jgi:hypothetical protein
MAKRKSTKNDSEQTLSPTSGSTVSNPVERLEGAVAAANPASRKITKKPEIVRAEPRANLVPINLDDEIRNLAYLLSERRGFQPGHETEDWLEAEREVLGRYQQQRA